jgi:predicted nucleic acid-binding protein/uncharacterized protein YbdZ (MbtH family)
MRSLFPGYYAPETTEDTFWREAIFVFDANILLNAYRYSEDAREKLLQAIETIGDRCFLPYQAALEFQRNRINALRDRKSKYAEASLFFEKLSDDVAKMSSKDKKGASLRDDLEKAWELADLEPGLKRASEYLRECESKILRPSLSDAIRERIDALFDSKIGTKPASEQAKKWHEEAAHRIEKKIPPGYKDAHKENLDSHGDVLVWLQAIEFVTGKSLPVVFVSDDLKEDWYWEQEGQKIGPRIELVDEMFEKAGSELLLCDCARFIERTWEILIGTPENQTDEDRLKAVVDEAREVQKSTTSSADTTTDRDELETWYQSHIDLPQGKHRILPNEELQLSIWRDYLSSAAGENLNTYRALLPMLSRNHKQALYQFEKDWDELQDLDDSNLYKAKLGLDLLGEMQIFFPSETRKTHLEAIQAFRSELNDLKHRSGESAAPYIRLLNSQIAKTIDAQSRALLAQ